MINFKDNLKARFFIWLLMPLFLGCANFQQAERSTIEELIVGEPGNFHGYKMYSFTFQDRTCRVVTPKKPADKYPWIWRAHFFGHRPEVDLALLSKGFHVAYIDVSDLYGSPEAVRIWNDFYNYLTGEYQFARKVALEGMSVGGLIVFNWAEKNPEKISCIYVDAPVCDIRSWPGGFKSGRGSEGDWQKCLRAYDLTEEEALRSEGHPAGRMEPLVKHKVPVLIVSGDADDVVPYEENAAIVEEEYKEMKGNIKVIMKKEAGHTHGLENAQPIVNFISKHTRKKN